MLMSFPVYVLRRSVSSVSSALYSSEKRNISVRIIQPQSDNHISSQKAAFIQVGNEDSGSHGEQLTYGQLLNLLLEAEKVVTL
jgi:hypothetical protein